MNAIHPGRNLVIAQTELLEQETAVTAAPVLPGQLANHRRNKPERCSPDIFAVRCQDFLNSDVFGPAELLRLLRKAMTRITRRPFSRARNARGGPLDLCPTNRGWASAIH